MEPPDPMFDRDTSKLKIAKWWCCFLGVAFVVGMTWPFIYIWRYWQGYRLRTRADRETVLSLAHTYNRHLYPAVDGFVNSFFPSDTHFTYMRLPCWHPALSKVVVQCGPTKLVLTTHL